MDQGTAALTGAVIGASAGIFGSILTGVALEAYRRRRDRQGTASAFAGEIASMLYLVERREHVKFFTQVLATLKSGQDVPIPNINQGRDLVDPVADRFLDKIGLLPGDFGSKLRH